MEERYPDLEESDNSVISTDTNATIPPTTTEGVQDQESLPKDVQEEEPQPKPVSLPDGKQSPAHRVSSKQRRLSLDEYSTVFLPVPKIDHPKPVFISESLRDVIGLPLRLSKNLTRWHEGLEASA